MDPLLGLRNSGLVLPRQGFKVAQFCQRGIPFELWKSYALIVDESHQLPFRLREALGILLGFSLEEIRCACRTMNRHMLLEVKVI